MEHHYHLHILWTGNNGSGTSRYDAYERSHHISGEGKPTIEGSSDTPFRGDASKYNPEDMLLASLAVCHMLWYLHLCADKGIVVTHYEDDPKGTLYTGPDGGRFTEAHLHPKVTITQEDQIGLANQLHHEAHKKCFIANSVNFPIHHHPTTMSVDLNA